MVDGVGEKPWSIDRNSVCHFNGYKLLRVGFAPIISVNTVYTSKVVITFATLVFEYEITKKLRWVEGGCLELPDSKSLGVALEILIGQ